MVTLHCWNSNNTFCKMRARCAEPVNLRISRSVQSIACKIYSALSIFCLRIYIQYRKGQGGYHAWNYRLQAFYAFTTLWYTKTKYLKCSLQHLENKANLYLHSIAVFAFIRARINIHNLTVNFLYNLVASINFIKDWLVSIINHKSISFPYPLLTNRVRKF